MRLASFTAASSGLTGSGWGRIRLHAPKRFGASAEGPWHPHAATDVQP